MSIPVRGTCERCGRALAPYKPPGRKLSLYHPATIDYVGATGVPRSFRACGRCVRDLQQNPNLSIERG